MAEYWQKVRARFPSGTEVQNAVALTTVAGEQALGVQIAGAAR